jgi:cell division protein FtsN
MRFEVKGGGMTAILLGIVMLSGAVFVLGLLAGYDVGRQAQIDAAQFATSYPLQVPSPSGAASPEGSTAEPGNPPLQSATSTSASPRTGPNEPATGAATANQSLAGNSGPGRRASQTVPSPARARLASASTPSTQPAFKGSRPVDEDSASADSGDSDTGDSSAASDEAPGNATSPLSPGVAAQPVHRKPYNIQIQAAMDITGADNMMARLQKLGYASHLVPTEIAGQRWYKIEVGPYATAEEASSAEAELRQKYDQTYGGVTRGKAPAETDTNGDSEE